MLKARDKEMNKACTAISLKVRLLSEVHMSTEMVIFKKRSSPLVESGRDVCFSPRGKEGEDD